MNQDLTSVIGNTPFRMAFAGGWIDQPFLSQLNPSSPGSMVVVALEPTSRFMNRCGMSTSTREVAMNLWGPNLPKGTPEDLVKELYTAENEGKPEPSGSQDMIGLLYPGVSRLDYDYNYEGGYFPCHIESNNDPDVAQWLEEMIYMVPVAPRPDGYNPLREKNLDPKWVERLGQSGKDCYNAIITKDTQGLGASMNECMICWETLLPHVVRHPTIHIDLMGILEHYQSKYIGAMYSGCGGGYIYVVSDEPVPGALRVDVRYNEEA